jgi:hypothetical protein
MLWTHVRGLELGMLIRSAAACSTLTELILPFAHSSDTLDASLANLLQSEMSSLQTLTISHSHLSHNETGTVSYPSFLRALKRCFRIQHVTLRFDSMSGNPWSSDFRKEIAMVTRLNRSGRSYLQLETFDQLAGFRVLEQVNDDLDCLFFHLRENPALSQLQST